MSQKQAEEVLRESEARKAAILDAAPVAIVAIDHQGRITELNQAAEQMFSYARNIIDSSLDMIIAVDTERRIVQFNRAAEETFGYREEEVLGTHVRMLYADFEQSEEIFQAMLETGRCVIEILNRRKNGEIFPCYLAASRICDQAGQVLGYMGVSRDITERKRAEEEIREKAELLDLVPDAIVVSNLEHRILFWNKGAERLYGWTAAQAIGHNLKELIYRDIAWFEAAEKILLDMGEWNGELRQLTRCGNEVIVSSRWTLLRDAKGNPKSILIINTDVTERKKIEAQFLRAQRIESIGTLASGVAHDLNNILAPILMAAQVLRLKPFSQEYERLMAIIEANAQRGADIVKQVVAFARGVEGERIPLQPRVLVKEVIKITKGTFPKNIAIKSNICSDPWTVCGDVTQLHQVLLNLCVNARDAMPEGGTLSVVMNNLVVDETYAGMSPGATAGPYVVLEVSDTGVGIPPEIRDKIFNPFFTTKAAGQGTGLGLSVVSGIVRSHGGFVRVESEIGRGSVFKVFLPARPSELDEVRKCEQNVLPSGQGEVILVVDDEVNIRETLQTLLTTHGYQVLVAGDGVEAMVLFSQHADRIKLVLTDLDMPIMDGMALVVAVKKFNPKVKIVASSGLENRLKEWNSAAELNGLGIETFLTKPYRAEVLLSMVHELLP